MSGVGGLCGHARKLYGAFPGVGAGGTNDGAIFPRWGIHRMKRGRSL